GGASVEHPDLVAVRVGAEVAADDERDLRILSVVHVGEEAAYGILSSLALVEPPGIHHQAVHLDGAAWPGDPGVVGAGGAEGVAGLTPDRPARQNGHAGERGLVLLRRDAAHGVVRQAD